LFRAAFARAAAKAINDYQQNRIKRIKSLYERGAINEDELQQFISESVKSKFLYEETLAQHKLIVDGPRPEKIAQAIARVAFQTAVVEKLADQIVKHTLVSPFDGYVVAEHTEVGEWVDRGDLVAEVVALGEVHVVAQVLDKHVSYVKKGMTVRVNVPALPDQIFTGKIVQIIPQADVRSRTFPVVVRVKNEISDEGPLLKSGMLVRTLLPTGPQEKALLVSKDALVLNGQDRSIFVIDPNPDGTTGIARKVAVQLGVASEGWIQVDGDVQEGQLVVIEGNERLQPDSEVTIVHSKQQ